MSGQALLIDDWLRTAEEVLVDFLAVSFRDKPVQFVSYERVLGIKSRTWWRVPVVNRGIAFYHAVLLMWNLEVRRSNVCGL